MESILETLQKTWDDLPDKDKTVLPRPETEEDARKLLFEGNSGFRGGFFLPFILGMILGNGFWGSNYCNPNKCILKDLLDKKNASEKEKADE